MGIRALTREIRVNVAEQDLLWGSEVAPLDDGGFVVTWAGQNFGFPSVVWARRFTAEGLANGSQIMLDNSDASPLLDASLLPGRGFLVTYARNGDQKVAGRTPNNDGSEITVAANLDGTSRGGVAAPLTNGDFVVAWESRNRADRDDGSGSTIVARVLGASFQPRETDFVVNTTAMNAQSDPTLAGLSGGGFVAAWKSYENGNGVAPVVRMRVFGADGDPVANDRLVAVTGGPEEVTALALADGGFALAWRAWPEEGSGIAVHARLYDANGDARSRAFVVSDVDFGNDYAPSMAKLDDGRFVVVWRDTDVKARLFDEDGTALGGEFRISTDNGDPDVTALAGGRFVVTWKESNEVVRAKVYDARAFEGTRGADRWLGGDAKDTVSGLGGNDRLYGRDGNDCLEGGSGDDRLSGGAGRDVLDGGSGADVLTGGDDGDRFLFGSAAQARGDRVADFASGEDRLDLSAINARADRPGDQAFVYIRGRDFSGRPGELRLEVELLAGDTDGDRRADFAIRLTDVETLRAADLVL